MRLKTKAGSGDYIAIMSDFARVKEVAFILNELLQNIVEGSATSKDVSTILGSKV